MTNEDVKKLRCKTCGKSRLVRGVYWFCDELRMKVDGDDTCHQKPRTSNVTETPQAI